MNRKKKIHYYYSQSGYSAELQAVIDQWDSLGYDKPDDNVLIALNSFIAKRKADGSWTAIDQIWITAFNDATLSNAATVGFKNPSANKFTLANSPIYGVGGFTGDALSAFIDANLNPSTNGGSFTQNSASRGLWVYAAPTSGTMMDGLTTSNMNRSAYANSLAHRINAGANLSVAVDFTGTGYKGLNRTTANDCQFYNGLTRSNRTSASTALTNEEFVLLKSTTSFSDVTIAVYFVGGSLTETQHNNISNDFGDYLTEIGL